MEDSEAEEAWLEAVQRVTLRIGRERRPIPKASKYKAVSLLVCLSSVEAHKSPALHTCTAISSIDVEFAKCAICRRYSANSRIASPSDGVTIQG